MNKISILAVFLAALFVACNLTTGCNDKKASEIFSRVEISQLGNPETIDSRVIVLREPSAIDEVASFFPGFTGSRKSNSVSGWEAMVIFVFTQPSGETVRVRSNYTLWSTKTHAESEVNGDLESYVKKLYAETNVEVKQPSTNATEAER